MYSQGSHHRRRKKNSGFTNFQLFFGKKKYFIDRENQSHNKLHQTGPSIAISQPHYDSGALPLSPSAWHRRSRLPLARLYSCNASSFGPRMVWLALAKQAANRQALQLQCQLVWSAYGLARTGEAGCH